MTTNQIWTTDEDKADELELYAMTTYEWHQCYAEPIARNMARKMKRGTYDRARLVEFLAGEPLRAAATMYRAEVHAAETFPISARRIAAEGIADSIEEHASDIIANPTTN